MPALILHISDIHLLNSTDHVLGRVSQIAAAACSDVTLNVDTCYIVMSGDLTQSGSANEFLLANQLLSTLAAEIQSRINVDSKFFLIPGNHDCKLPADPSARNDIIENIKRKGSSEAREQQLITAQIDFWEFQKGLASEQGLKSAWETEFCDSVRGVTFVGINTALLSTGGDDQGRLFIPVDGLTKGQRNGLVIYVLHHPLNWLQADNSRDLTEYLRERGDVVLFGHEHREDSIQTKPIYSEASLESYFADVLQDRKAFFKSGFRTIALTDDGLKVKATRYQWVGDRYEPDAKKSDADWRELTRNTERGKVLSFAKSHLEWLDDAGAAFSHRKKDEIKLADVFVWPSLRETFSDGKQTLLVDSQRIDSEDLLRNLEINKIVFVLGEEQSGKTTLAKKWSLEARNLGLFPLYISASKDDNFKKLLSGDTIERYVKEQYGSSSAVDYMQLGREQRLLILDDFEPLKGKNSSRDEILQNLQQHFARIFLLVDSSPGAEIVLETINVSVAAVECKTFDMLPFGYGGRMELIEKWLSIGNDEDIDSNEFESTCARLSKIVDDTLGRNLIPSFALFILIILQQSETERDLDAVIKNGSHGFLYQALISQTLSKRVKLFSVDTSTTYLTEFAAVLFEKKEYVVDADAAEEFHKNHVLEFDLDYSFERVKKQLLNADVWMEKDGKIGFRYPYLYYFFVANHLKSQREADLFAAVDDLLASIHTERSANILLFLAHLTLNQGLVERLLAHARTFFADAPEYNVFENLSLLEKLGVNKTRQVYVEYANRKEALRDLEQQDADVLNSNKQEIDDQLMQDRDTLLLVNRAFKTLQVLGQVLRNHSGSIKGPLKKSIMEVCVSLGLRTLGSIYDVIERNVAGLLEYRFDSQTAGLKAHRIDAEAMKADASDFLNGQVLNIATGTLVRIANAIGSEELAPTITRVLSVEKHDSRNLIDLSVRLENFTKFPKDQVVAFKSQKISAGYVLPIAIVRQFLVRRFYLFPENREVRAQICDLYKISRKPYQLRAANRKLSRDN